MRIGPGEVMVAGIVMTAIATSIRFIANAAVRYQENRLKYENAGTNAVSDARLERIEHAVDAMAIEIERISEGQRFTTKLLADRSAERALH